MEFFPAAAVVDGPIDAVAAGMREAAEKRMKAILAALVENAADLDDLFIWPIPCGRVEELGDRRILRGLGQRLRLTEAEWRRIVRETLELTSSAEYLQLVSQVSGELGYRPVLRRSDLALLSGKAVR